MKEEWIDEGFKDLKDYEVIREIVAQAIRDCADPTRTTPSWIANAAYRKLDPENTSPLPIKVAALSTFERDRPGPPRKEISGR